MTKKTANKPAAQMSLKLFNLAKKKIDIQPGIYVEVNPLPRSKSRTFLIQAGGDMEEYRRLVADYVICDWAGLVDEDGTPLAVDNLDNKLLVYEHPLVGNIIDEHARAFELITGQELGN